MGRPTIPESTIREILTSTESHGVLARRHSIHRSAVSSIRLGKIHRQVAPELPRWQPEHVCGHCIHWEGECCGLDFPDPLVEGQRFAASCSVFTRR
jgi:hypothetical protein